MYASFFVVFMLAVCIEVNVFPVCDTIYRGIGGITPHILNLGDRWEWSTSCRGRFIIGKEPQYPLNTRLDEGLVSSRSSLNDLEEKKNFVPQPGFILRIIHPVAWSL